MTIPLAVNLLPLSTSSVISLCLVFVKLVILSFSDKACFTAATTLLNSRLTLDHMKSSHSAVKSSSSTNKYATSNKFAFETAVESIIQKIKGGVRVTYNTGGHLIVHHRSRRQIKREQVDHIVVKLIEKPQNVSHLIMDVSGPADNDKLPANSFERMIARKKIGKVVSFIVPVGPHLPEKIVTGGNEMGLSQGSAAMGSADLLNVVGRLMTKVDALEKAVKNDHQYRVQTADITNEILKTVDRLEAGLTQKHIVSMSNGLGMSNVVRMSNAVGIPVHKQSSDSGVTSVLAGHSTSLYCAVDTTDHVNKIQWFKPDGSQIGDDTSRYRIDHNMLYIHHTIITDQGTYRCTVEQQDGKTDTADATLVVSICSDKNPCKNDGKCIDVPNEDEVANVNVGAGETYRRAVVDKYTVTRCVCPVGFYGTLCQHAEKTHAALTYFSIFVCILIFLCLAGICCCCCFRNVRNVAHEDSFFAKTFGYYNDGSERPLKTEIVVENPDHNRNEHKDIPILDVETHHQLSRDGSYVHSERAMSYGSFTDDHVSRREGDSGLSNRGSTRSFTDDHLSARTGQSGSPRRRSSNGVIGHSDPASLRSGDSRLSDHFTVISGDSRMSDHRSVRSSSSRPSEHQSERSALSHRSNISFVDDHKSVKGEHSDLTFDHMGDNRNHTVTTRRPHRLSSKVHSDYPQDPEFIYGQCRPCPQDVPKRAACDHLVCSKCGDRLDEPADLSQCSIDLPNQDDTCEDREPDEQKAESKKTSCKRSSGKGKSPSRSPSACSQRSVGSEKNQCETRSRSQKASSKCPSETSSACCTSPSELSEAKCDAPSKSPSACSQRPVCMSKARSCSRAPECSKVSDDTGVCPVARVTSPSVHSKSSRRGSSDRLTTDTEPLYSVRTDDCLPNVDSVPCRGPLQLRPQSLCRWVANMPSVCGPCRNRCSTSLPEPRFWNSSSAGRDRFRSFSGRKLPDPCYYRRAYSCGNTPNNVCRTWSPCRYNYGNTQCTSHLYGVYYRKQFSADPLDPLCYRSICRGFPADPLCDRSICSEFLADPLDLLCDRSICREFSADPLDPLCDRSICREMDDEQKTLKKKKKGRKSPRSARRSRNKNETSRRRKSSRSSGCPEENKNKNKKIKRRKPGSGLSRNTGAMTKGSQSSACSESDRRGSSYSGHDSNIVSVTAHSCQSRPCSTGLDTSPTARGDQCSEEQDSNRSKRAPQLAPRKKKVRTSDKSKQSARKSDSPKQNNKWKKDKNKRTKKPIIKSAKKPAKSDGGSASSAQSKSGKESVKSSARSSAKSSARSTDRSCERSSASKSSTVCEKRNKKKQRSRSNSKDSQIFEQRKKKKKQRSRLKSKDSKRTSKSRSKRNRRPSSSMSSLTTSGASCSRTSATSFSRTSATSCQSGTSSYKTKSPSRRRQRSSSSPRTKSRRRSRGRKPHRQEFSSPSIGLRRFSSSCGLHALNRRQFSPYCSPQLDSCCGCIDGNVDLAECLDNYAKAPSPCRRQFSPFCSPQLNLRRSCVDRNVDLAECLVSYVNAAYMDNFRPGSGRFPPPPVPPVQPCMFESGPRERFSVNRSGGACVGRQVRKPLPVCPSVTADKLSNRHKFPVVPVAPASSCNSSLSFYSLGWELDCVRPPPLRQHAEHSHGLAAVVPLKSEIPAGHHPKSVTIAEPSASSRRHGNEGQMSTVPGEAVLVWSKDTAHSGHAHPQVQVSGTPKEVPQSSTTGQAALVWSKETANPRHTHAQVSGTRKEDPSSTPGQAVLVWSKETVDPKHIRPQASGKKVNAQSSTPGPAVLVWSKETVDPTHNRLQAIETRKEVQQSSTPGGTVVTRSTESFNPSNTHRLTDDSRNQATGQIAGQSIRHVRKDSRDDFLERAGRRQNDNLTTTVGHLDSSNEILRQETQRRQTVTTTTTTHHHHHHHGHQYPSASNQQQLASRNSAEFNRSGMVSDDGRKSMQRGASQPRSNTSRPLDDPVLVKVAWSGKNASSNATRASRVSSATSNFLSQTSMPVPNQNNEQADNGSKKADGVGVPSTQTAAAAVADVRQSSRLETSRRRQQHIEQMKYMQQMKQLDRKREMDEVVDETVKSISQSFSASHHILK